MSDTPAQFAAKNKAQFDKFDAQMNAIARIWIGKLAWALISTTPGPNLQTADTEYIATGRLRAGWRWTVEIGEATNWKDGPYTEDGLDTLADIQATVAAAPLVPMSYLWTDVGYGALVHDGKGRHKWPRPWRDAVANPVVSQGLADEARQEAMAL